MLLWMLYTVYYKIYKDVQDGQVHVCNVERLRELCLRTCLVLDKRQFFGSCIQGRKARPSIHGPEAFRNGSEDQGSQRGNTDSDHLFAKCCLRICPFLTFSLNKSTRLDPAFQFNSVLVLFE